MFQNEEAAYKAIEHVSIQDLISKHLIVQREGGGKV